ncbi:SAM-dependent methyltransferase [Streptomonospora wellingtoniae]|uniref:SAM-dependent methyltransferase n=1 Tax=Streptomonospora wellingtoniae TaxID=3075544 RepID=A0ABU2KY46_9ACTN|nr:SAM-dependent methyltransferase [Streptomonospora sp. DSM 45055]MDT0304234.1 SAM-dependent methyltransferase [Streptomonospora sp. DSM 45055]
MSTDPSAEGGHGLPTVASAARLYDYYLGGKNNFAVDRELGERIEQQIPEIRQMARANRRFLARAVDYMARQGVDQFLDIGSGLPAEDPVHEVVRRRVPEARVVYVDHDPVVRVHAEALLADRAEITGVVEADMRDPEVIFGRPDLTGRLDLNRPVGLLLVAMLHFLQDHEDPYGLLRRYVERLPTDSYVAISHVENETAPDRAAALERFYASTSSPGQTRSRAGIARFFDGLELVDPPGLTHVDDWTTEPSPVVDAAGYIPPERAWGLAGVARIP